MIDWARCREAAEGADRNRKALGEKQKEKKFEPKAMEISEVEESSES